MHPKNISSIEIIPNPTEFVVHSFPLLVLPLQYGQPSLIIGVVLLGGKMSPRTVVFSSVAHWSQFLLLLFTDNAIVSAQSSSCGTAQCLQAGSPSEGIITMDSAVFDLCGGGSISESELRAGHWFSYATSLSENRITRVQVQCLVGGCDAMSGEIAPILEIFRGPCDSLTCQDISILQAAYDRLFENEVGVEYFFYVYTLFAAGSAPYLITFEEIEPPPSDNMEGAIALTSQDLPYEGSFTTYGARSDRSLDACGLDGKYGVWFTYQTTWPSQGVVLRATDNLGFAMAVGVQVADNKQFACIDYSIAETLFDVIDKIEWIAESGILYFILIASPSPYYSGEFGLTLQSRGVLPAPASASIPDPPVAAPAASDQASQVTTAPTTTLIAPGDSKLPEQLPSDSSSTSGDAGVIFNSSLSLVISGGLASFFCFWF